MGSWERTSQAQNSSSASPVLPSFLHPAHSSACPGLRPRCRSAPSLCIMPGAMCGLVLWQLLPVGIHSHRAACQAEAGAEEAELFPDCTRMFWLSSTEPCLPERLIPAFVLTLPLPMFRSCARISLTKLALTFDRLHTVKFARSCFIFRGIFTSTIPFHPHTVGYSSSRKKNSVFSWKSRGFFHWPKLNSRFALTSEFTPRTFKSCQIHRNWEQCS